MASSSSLGDFYAEERARDARRRKAIRSEQCRQAGKASGKKRRLLARGRRAYQASAAQVRELFERDCEAYGWDDQPGQRAVSERGFQTLLALYREDWRGTRGNGCRGFETTNHQRAAAMTERGRERCDRTVQRTRLRLQRMGLVAYVHVKRHGSLVGHRDTIRVYVLSPCRSGRGNGALTAPRSVPSKALIGPPDGGREPPPDKPAETAGIEDEGCEPRGFDLAAARRQIEADLASGQRKSIFDRYSDVELDEEDSS